MGGCKDGARVFSMIPSERTRGNGHKQQEIPSDKKKILFYSEGGQALEEVAQKGCGASIFVDIKIPTGHCAGQPALAEDA